MAAFTLEARGVEAMRNALLATDKRVTEKSFNQEARKIFLTANRQICPVDTGFLRDSFDPRISRQRVSLHWSANYANFVFLGTRYFRGHAGKAHQIAQRGARALEQRVAFRLGQTKAGRARTEAGRPVPGLGSFTATRGRIERQRPANYRGAGASAPAPRRRRA